MLDCANTLCQSEIVSFIHEASSRRRRRVRDSAIFLPTILGIESAPRSDESFESFEGATTKLLSISCERWLTVPLRRASRRNYRRSTSRPRFRNFLDAHQRRRRAIRRRGWDAWLVAEPESHPGRFCISCRHVPAQALLELPLFPHPPLFPTHYCPDTPRRRSQAICSPYYQDTTRTTMMSMVRLASPQPPRSLALLATGAVHLALLIRRRRHTHQSANCYFSTPFFLHSTFFKSLRHPPPHQLNPVHQINQPWLVVTIEMDTVTAIAAHGIPGSAGSSSLSSSSASSSSSLRAGKHLDP